jgi:hypothetical protein
MIEQVYELSGELTQIDPYNSSTGSFDLSTTGANKVLRWLNQAQTAIVAWKRPQNAQYFAWDNGYVQKFLTRATLQAGVCGPDSTTDVIKITPPAESVGKFIALTGIDETRQIIAQTGTEVILDRAFDVEPANLGYVIMANYVEIPDDEHWLAISQVFSLPDKIELTLIRDRGYFAGDEINVDVPTRFYRSGKRIYFDAVSRETLKLSLIVLEAPPKLTSSDQVPVVYEQFHYAFVIWTMIQVFGMAQETNMKYSFTKQFEEIMMTTQTPRDFADADLAGSIGVEVN